MNIQFYWEKLNDMKGFKDFIEKNPDAYLCSGFFIIDKQGTDNKQHFDFYLPKEKTIQSFEMENSGQRVPIQQTNPELPEPLPLSNTSDFNIEFGEIEELIDKEIEKQGIKAKIQKIMVSVQSKPGSEDKTFLICTIFLSGLGMANVTISVKDKKVISFEKKSLFDFVKRAK